jgi:predicted enzyme related to lactoylglutathione lyase
MIVLQEMAEPKAGKNRMHLDIHVDDLEAEVARLEALGATRVEPGPIEGHGHAWYVLADPEGNELCLVQRPAPRP